MYIPFQHKAALIPLVHRPHLPVRPQQRPALRSRQSGSSHSQSGNSTLAAALDQVASQGHSCSLQPPFNLPIHVSAMLGNVNQPHSAFPKISHSHKYVNAYMLRSISGNMAVLTRCVRVTTPAIPCEQVHSHLVKQSFTGPTSLRTIIWICCCLYHPAGRYCRLIASNTRVVAMGDAAT